MIAQIHLHSSDDGGEDRRANGIIALLRDSELLLKTRATKSTTRSS
jgi:hypothetical protein